MTQSCKNSWISVAGTPDAALTGALEQSIEQRLSRREFRADEVLYISQADFSPVQGQLEASEQELNVLRRLCQAWDIQLRPGKITSHRPLIGPIIVAVKKLFFPIVSVFMRDLVKQQRDFNAASIALMGRLLSERSRNK